MTNVVQQPVMSMARILRPYPQASTVYQGQSGYKLLMVTEQGEALDELAGNGYLPTFVRGTPVTMGSRVNLWLPRLQPGTAEEPTGSYIWAVGWRLRNVRDAQLAGKPAHFPLAQPTDNYFPAPVAWHSVVYNQTEPSGANMAVQHVWPEQFQVYPGNLTSAPASPIYLNSTTGKLASGVNDSVNYEIVDLTAQGDELLLGCYKSDGANWDFTPVTGDDVALFSFLTQTAMSGVYALFGISP